ncbi:hypothetical protein Cgig2_029809 [Carnegiea gigantea]|uniref:Uncharacterized protein n=1 Tax=Carnegiea gigantea TaxID=171969 RepID=A0A9Q1KK75_9CARY|nr:hypothetical protein Cgig2_029809 [Carnegiea gigantea]
MMSKKALVVGCSVEGKRDNCTKGEPSLSSSEKGKKKVSSGNKRPQKKNKRTPNDQSSDTETLDQQDAPTRKIEIPLPEAPPVAVERSDIVVIAIIPVSEMSDDLVEVMPIQSISTSLASLFCNLKEDCVRESILKGVEYNRDLLAFLQIEEIFGVAETAVKIKDSMDIDGVKALSGQDLTCSSEITHIEDQLNNLSREASKPKVKEQEILREEEWIRKMREDLNIQQ